MTGNPHDPRSEAEKARADLKRNIELGMAVPESPLTRQPSVTPDTFGEHGERARRRSGIDQGVEAGGRVRPGRSDSSESIAESAQVTTGRDHTAPPAESDEPPAESDEDVLSRAKE